MVHMKDNVHVSFNLSPGRGLIHLPFKFMLVIDRFIILNKLIGESP